MTVEPSAERELLNVLVLEDEWIARNFLVEILEASGLASVMGAVASLDEANEFLATASGIDVVFVDINLAGSNDTGLDLVRAHHSRPGAPKFVFATAVRDHALEAFELGAVDYVTKPFSSERIVQCLGRLARQRTSPPSTVPKRIVARRRRSLVFLDVDQIWAFESSDRLAVVHSLHGVFDIDLTLAAIELSFGKRFLRVHRNWLVNTTHVRELERESGDTVLIIGAGYDESSAGIRVPVARDRALAVREQLLATSTGVRQR